MEEANNKLEVTIEDGTTVTVNVLDFVDSLEFGKTFIIYTVNNESDTIFASILNEAEDSYSLEKGGNSQGITAWERTPRRDSGIPRAS